MPTTVDRGALIAELVKVAPPIIRERWSVNCCIAATRLAVEALAYFGVEARPVPVLAIACNGAGDAMLRDGKLWSPENAPEWERTGAWSVGVGFDNDNGVDNVGHLVALVDNVLVDLTLDQASRPAKGITLEPCALTIEPAEVLERFLNDGGGLRFADDESKIVLEYVVNRDMGRRFESFPDWRKVERLRPFVGRVIRELKRVKP